MSVRYLMTNFDDNCLLLIIYNKNFPYGLYRHYWKLKPRSTKQRTQSAVIKSGLDGQGKGGRGKGGGAGGTKAENQNAEIKLERVGWEGGEPTNSFALRIGSELSGASARLYLCFFCHTHGINFTCWRLQPIEWRMYTRRTGRANWHSMKRE